MGQLQDGVVLAVTGHRPERLGLDYSPHSNFILTKFAAARLSALMERKKISRVVSGMAQGWDQAVAHAAITLKIPLTAALPFDGHGRNWPAGGRLRHDALMEEADEVVVVTPGPYGGKKDSWKYVERDHYLCDRARAGRGLVLALFDGKPAGGTWSTLEYAGDLGLEVVNAWDEWSRGNLS